MVLCPPFRWASRSRYKFTVPVENPDIRRETIFVSITKEIKYLTVFKKGGGSQLDYCFMFVTS